MHYYTMLDIREITGCSQNKSYEIIRELNKQYKKEFPDSVTTQGRVPKWFFEEKMGVGKDGKYEKETKTEAIC